MTDMSKVLRGKIKEANDALSDLNMFAAIVAILEGGSMSSGSQPDQFRIINQAQNAQARCLRRYDKAMAALGAPYPGNADL